MIRIIEVSNKRDALISTDSVELILEDYDGYTVIAHELYNDGVVQTVIMNGVKCMILDGKYSEEEIRNYDSRAKRMLNGVTNEFFAGHSHGIENPTSSNDAVES